MAGGKRGEMDNRFYFLGLPLAIPHRRRRPRRPPGCPGPAFPSRRSTRGQQLAPAWGDRVWRASCGRQCESGGRVSHGNPPHAPPPPPDRQQNRHSLGANLFRAALLVDVGRNNYQPRKSPLLKEQRTLNASAKRNRKHMRAFRPKWVGAGVALE